MINSCNYDILENIKYADELFYTTMERKEDLSSSADDIITKLIYIGELKSYEDLELKAESKKLSPKKQMGRGINDSTISDL